MKTLKNIWRWMRAHWKGMLKTACRLALVAIGIIAALIIFEYAYDKWDDHFGTRGSRMISQKHKIRVVYFADGTDRVKDLKTGRWTTPKLRWVADEPPVDSISVFCDREGRRGFYNTHTGKITIKGQYKHAWYFSDGVAAVVGDDDRVQFINYDGSPAVPGRYHYSPGYDYVFKDGLCQIWIDSTNTSGLLRKDGTWALEPVYEHLSETYKGGWRITSADDHWQLWTADFTPVFPETYEHITMNEERNAVYLTKNHIKQMVDFEGNVLEPFVIDRTRNLHYLTQYSEEECDEYDIVPEVVVYCVGCREGLMDKRTGRILTPPAYYDLSMISRTLVRAQFEYWDDASIILDLKGNIVKPVG